MAVQLPDGRCLSLRSVDERYGKGGRDGIVRHILLIDENDPADFIAICGRRVDGIVRYQMSTCMHCQKKLTASTKD